MNLCQWIGTEETLANCSLLPGFLKEVLLEHNQSHIFTSYLWLFRTARVVLSSHHRDRMWPTKQKIFIVCTFKEKFASPGLDPGLKAQQAKWTRSIPWSSALWRIFLLRCPLEIPLRALMLEISLLPVAGLVCRAKWNKPWALYEAVGGSHRSYRARTAVLGLLLAKIHSSHLPKTQLPLKMKCFRAHLNLERGSSLHAIQDRQFGWCGCLKIYIRNLISIKN